MEIFWQVVDDPKLNRTCSFLFLDYFHSVPPTFDKFHWSSFELNSMLGVGVSDERYFVLKFLSHLLDNFH